MIYHVTCNTDDNYAQHCCAMLCSLFENNKEYNFHVHILTHGLAEESKSFLHSLCNRYNNELTIYEVDESKLDGVQFRISRPLTKAAYYRILLPEILDKSIKKILYLDCDMVVVGNVIELYDLELDHYALAATLDCMPFNSGHRNQLHMETDERTFCSGMMLINLQYWREVKATEKLLDFSKRTRKPVWLHDQDSLNYVFKKQWFLLPPKWNKVSVSFLPNVQGLSKFDIYEYVYEPKIIHFSSEAKPWLDMSFPYSKEYRKYLELSGFLNPTFIKLSISEKCKFCVWNCRYYTRKYILPFIPQTIIIVLSDIFNLINLLMSSGNKGKMRSFILDQSIKRFR